MTSRNALNLILLLVVAGLVTLAVLQPGIDPPAVASRLVDSTPLAGAKVTRISLTRPGQPEIRLQRDADGRWQMTSPYHAATNQFVDSDLSALLSAESSAHYPLTDITPANVGLQPPVATLTLNQTTLLFGDIDPVHGNRYVQAGDTVHLVPDHLTPYAELGALEMLSTALLPAGSKITSLRLPALVPAGTSGSDDTGALPATLPYQIERGDNGWTSDPPLSLSGDALPGLVNEWHHAQAIAVAPLSTWSSTTDIADEHIEITLESGQQLVFEVLQLTPELVLARRDTGLRYQLSQEQAYRLLRPTAHNPAP